MQCCARQGAAKWHRTALACGPHPCLQRALHHDAMALGQLAAGSLLERLRKLAQRHHRHGGRAHGGIRAGGAGHPGGGV